MSVMQDMKSVNELITIYWLQLVEIAGEQAMKYLQVFYNEVASQSIENVFDVRKSLQLALQKHAEEDRCEFCQSLCCWCVCSKNDYPFLLLLKERLSLSSTDSPCIVHHLVVINRLQLLSLLRLRQMLSVRPFIELGSDFREPARIDR